MLFSEALVCLLLTVFVPAARTAAPVDDPSLDQVLSKSRQKYDDIEGFSCRFKQIVEISLLDKKKEFSGEMNYTSPNKLRLDYDDPGGGYILCDGRFFYIYLPDVDSTQVIKSPLNRDPRSFLTEFFLEEAQEDFTAELVGPGVPYYHIRFTPKESQAELLRVDVLIEPDSYLIRQISYTDPSGSVTTYVLENLSRKVRDDSFFRFSLPEGTRLLDITSDVN